MYHLQQTPTIIRLLCEEHAGTNRTRDVLRLPPVVKDYLSTHNFDSRV